MYMYKGISDHLTEVNICLLYTLNKMDRGNNICPCIKIKPESRRATDDVLSLKFFRHDRWSDFDFLTSGWDGGGGVIF